MSPNFKVAVIIPCFNHGEFLPEAVASAGQLGRDDVEAIVVDDGSTDERTQNEIKRLAEGGLKVVRQRNGGLAAARNAGIAATKAEYIFPLDADDRIRRDWVERGIQILNSHASVGVVYGDAQCFGTRSERWVVGGFDRAKLLDSNYIHASALFRRVIWEQNGGYDSSMPVQGYEDWDLWLAALEHGWDFDYMPEIFFDYRQHERSMITHAVAYLDQVGAFAGRKHGLLYREEYLSLLREHRELLVERGSIRATSRILRGLIKSRLKRQFSGASDGSNHEFANS